MIAFQNPGLIDVRAITTIGVSVKEKENPIGYFGTGLKYAIAIVLRLGGNFTIWRGLDPLRFEKRTVIIRGKPVDVVTMNGDELGFTTDLGKNWKPWQAFREVWCNMKDEDGICGRWLKPIDGRTTIEVELKDFEDCAENWHDFFIETPPVYSSPAVHFHELAVPSRTIFYRGIAVAQSKERPYRFAPNIQMQIDLTEDRTVANTYLVERLIAGAILQGKDPAFVEAWLAAGRDFQEYSFDIIWDYVSPGNTFLEVAKKLAMDPSRPMNPMALTILGKHVELVDPVEAGMLDPEREDLAAAIVFCHELQYPVDEFPITIVESLGDGILGRADAKRRRVLIARRTLAQGRLCIAATLIEEWVHLKHGYHDCTRELQNWLFEALTRLGAAYLSERRKAGSC